MLSHRCPPFAQPEEAGVGPEGRGRVSATLGRPASASSEGPVNPCLIVESVAVPGDVPVVRRGLEAQWLVTRCQWASVFMDISEVAFRFFKQHKEALGHVPILKSPLLQCLRQRAVP